MVDSHILEKVFRTLTSTKFEYFYHRIVCQ